MHTKCCTYTYCTYSEQSLMVYLGLNCLFNVSTTETVKSGQHILLMSQKSLLQQHCFVLTLLHKQFQLHVWSICCQNTLCKWNTVCSSFVVIVRHVMMYFSSRPVERARGTNELLYVFVCALDRSHFKTLIILEYI